MKRAILAWGPAASWAVLLFLLSEIRDAPSAVAPLLAIPDKLLHFAAYVVLGGLLAWARHASESSIRHVFLLALGSAYGAADEWHQSFVPGRNPDVWDWFADVGGVLVGYLFITFILSGAIASRARNRVGSE